MADYSAGTSGEQHETKRIGCTMARPGAGRLQRLPERYLKSR
jgi:hypothetical protein